MSEHEHKSKVTDWGFDEFNNWIPVLYGCTQCEETFAETPPQKESAPHEHTEYVEGCFTCKISTLVMGTGDASGNRLISGKKWDNELQFYRDARRQGIQPAGTSTKQIEAAFKASDNLGSAYNAERMMPAVQLTKSKVKAMKAMGV